MALEYTIERTEAFGEIELRAKPNEWATDARVTVVVKDDYPRGKDVPRIDRIGWSAGAREWTLEDARKFFTAVLKMLDAAEAELKKITVDKTRRVPAGGNE